MMLVMSKTWTHSPDSTHPAAHGAKSLRDLPEKGSKGIREKV